MTSSASSSNLPATQTVYRVTARNSIDDIKAFQEALPSIDDHEILVKIQAVAINYRDLAIANGGYPFPVAKNVIACSDGAGIVVKTGSKVEGFQIGDRLVGVFDPTNQYGPQKSWDHGRGGPVDGVLREYAVFTAAGAIKVPQEAKLSFAELASLVCTGVTAWNALYGNTHVKPGESVLIQGTGGVSMTTLMFANALGMRTIITSSSNDKLAKAQSMFGADHIINYKETPDWAAEARRITNGLGVDLVIENGGSGTIAQSLASVKMGGQVAVIGFLAQAKQEDMPDVAGLALSKGATVRGITVGSKQLFEEALNFVIVKDLHPPVEKTFKFDSHDSEGVLAAFKYVASGGHMGKVCISLE